MPRFLRLAAAALLAGCAGHGAAPSDGGPAPIPDAAPDSASSPSSDAAPDVPGFARDVQPILAQHCYACHGSDPAARQVGLRLDTPDGMFEARPGGAPPVVVKGDPGASLLVQRISAANPALRMPPPSSLWSLGDDEIDVITRWIAAGADFPQHWAFQKPVRPAPPGDGSDDGWSRNPVDRFIRAGLMAGRLTPSAEADRPTLIRRASFDIRGLPPSPAEIDGFVADTATDAYERLIERLLAEPTYGEQRAHFWLDVARYADTNGYEVDNYRSIWPYRDYVVRAFNDDMPFDRFTIEQLAGDLLPEPTIDQLVATGFGRNTMTTSEGGVIEDEVAAVAAKDRVVTVAAAFIGLTLGCASCHNHKFDPVTQREFYQMTAFFRNTTQAVLDDNLPDTPPAVVVGTGDDAAPSLITQEGTGNPFAYVLLRGHYNQPAERVGPDVPAVLPPLPADAPRNRLGLARWLTSPEHPLLARVAANRFWAELFGAGLVSTPDNFGLSGAPPTNQPLLDWLAVELRESGWDVKHLFRLMLTSATYRQAAVHTPAGDTADPANQLLSHGPRFRMDGEMIRDQALAASGLLVSRLGGPPVKPYQPPGLWEAVAIEYSNTANYVPDTGDALYRRSLYTFWKRAAPPATLQIFNAPSRETTVVQRERTNTPLQALAA